MAKRKFNYTLLTSREAAIELDLSPDLVNALARANRIPACKVGRQWRFKKRDIALFRKHMERRQLQAA